jgi:hypothetical protein
LQVAQEVCSGWIETEERVWMRQKWTRQFAQLDSKGMLRISSSQIHDKLQFHLAGAHAFVIEAADIGRDESASSTQHPTIQILLNASLQFGGEGSVTFRLGTMADATSWALALSR